MTPEEQTKSGCTCMPKRPSVKPSVLSRKQLKLAVFIEEQGAATYQDVVRAIENGRYKKVDQWKNEADMTAGAKWRRNLGR